MVDGEGLGARRQEIKCSAAKGSCAAAKDYALGGGRLGARRRMIECSASEDYVLGCKSSSVRRQKIKCSAA